MSTERELEQPLPREAEATETVVCDGLCDREVYEETTVDVVAGAVIGSWGRPTRHYGVSGTDGGDPVVEKWCLSCAQQKFGVAQSAHQERLEKARGYLSPRTLAAFLSGLTLATVVCLFLFFP